MKFKRSDKKLTLKRITIAQLNGNDLSQVVGGDQSSTPECPTNAYQTCYCTFGNCHTNGCTNHAGDCNID